jgi:hypothetical protein
MLNIYPHNVSTNLILPLFRDAASSRSKKRIRKAVQFSDEVQQEDIWLCESVQRDCVRRRIIAGAILCGKMACTNFTSFYANSLSAPEGFTDVN